MNVVNKLTLRHLRQNRSRTLITIIGIMLSVAMVCVVAGLVMSLRDMLIRTLMENGQDYHIAYYGVSAETAEQIAGEPVFSDSYTKPEREGELVTLYVRFANPDRNYMDIASEISGRYEILGMSANTELLALEGVIAQDNAMIAFIWIAAIAIIVIATGSVIVIANAFYISSSERVRQFGLLKSVGATKSQIARSIMFEAFILAVIAIPLGLAFGFLVQSGALLVTNGLLYELSALNNVDIEFRVVISPVIIYITVGVASLTLLISAWLPARRAAATSPIDAIRQTKDIRIRVRSMKTSKLTKLLFGFEGTLAAKSLKRSRGKYRAAVVSLTVSVVLFISISSLVGTINKGVQMEYGGMDFDVLIGAEASWEEAKQITGALKALPNSEVRTHMRVLLETTLPDGFDIYDATSENNGTILLHLIPDTEFVEIAGRSGTAVLINTTGVYSDKGKRIERVPYSCNPGTVLPLHSESEVSESETLGTVTISSVLREVPSQIPSVLFNGGLVNVLVPESGYEDLYQHSDSYTWYTVLSSDSEAFCKTAEPLILSILAEGKTLLTEDVAQMTRISRNIVGVMMLFGYGFIAMLSLIAVTSVISTISTGMALRRQEFAMLYSVGMTPVGMKKMLNLESLLYGFKSLCIGVPLGIFVSLLIHKGMYGMFEFSYRPPVQAVVISCVGVMVLTFCTMRYGRRKMNRISIVEALRREIA